MTNWTVRFLDNDGSLHSVSYNTATGEGAIEYAIDDNPNFTTYLDCTEAN